MMMMIIIVYVRRLLSVCCGWLPLCVYDLTGTCFSKMLFKCLYLSLNTSASFPSLNLYFFSFFFDI